MFADDYMVSHLVGRVDTLVLLFTIMIKGMVGFDADTNLLNLY